MAGELVERLRRRAEAMFALSDVSRNTSAAWRIEAKACLAKGSTDGITAADRIEALERENATLRAERDEATYEPWGLVRKGSDGSLAIFSPKFNTVKARFTPGNAVGWGMEEVIYRRAAAIRNMGGEG